MLKCIMTKTIQQIVSIHEHTDTSFQPYLLHVSTEGIWYNHNYDTFIPQMLHCKRSIEAGGGEKLHLLYKSKPCP